MTNELFLNGELILKRKDTHENHLKSIPVFSSRMEKLEYYKKINHFDIRNVLDLKGFLEHIKENWNTYVSQINQWIQKNPVKKLVVTGIFTVVLSVFSSTVNATYMKEYTYQVKPGDKIENIAAAHGVTAQEILDANGLSSIEGKKILLPQVQDNTVTATVLNVRSKPGIDSSIIAKFKIGDIVKTAFVENGWAGILIDGRVCFVSAAYLSPSQSSESAASEKVMYVTATSLKVRESPSMNSAVVGSLKFNDHAAVLSTLNGWAKIPFNGRTAFVSETYLTSNAVTTREIINSNNTSSSEYVIKRGDTFTKISKTIGISVLSIQELNPEVNPLKLKIGQTINIPAATAAITNQIKVTAQIGGVDPQGTFRFITSDGNTYGAQASGNLINELFDLQGKKAVLTLEGKRGQILTLISIQ